MRNPGSRFPDAWDPASWSKSRLRLLTRVWYQITACVTYIINGGPVNCSRVSRLVKKVTPQTKSNWAVRECRLSNNTRNKWRQSVAIWAVVSKKVPNALLLVWHRLFRIFPKKFFFGNFWIFFFFFFGKVGDIPKEGRARPRAPVLLLVWQRLRTLGTFLRGAPQMKTKYCYIGALQNTAALNMVNWDGPHKERDSDTEQWALWTCRVDRLTGLLERAKGRIAYRYPKYPQNRYIGIDSSTSSSVSYSHFQRHQLTFGEPCISADISVLTRHGPKPGSHEAEAEAFTILEAEAEASTLFNLEAEAEALV